MMSSQGFNSNVSRPSKWCLSLEWESSAKSQPSHLWLDRLLYNRHLFTFVRCFCYRLWTRRGSMVIYLYLMDKNTFQSPFPKNCGTLSFCPWSSLPNGGREKLLNVDSNYLLIWLIASGLCSNYTVGKTEIKRVNFWVRESNKLMSEECERDGPA